MALPGFISSKENKSYIYLQQASGVSCQFCFDTCVSNHSYGCTQEYENHRNTCLVYQDKGDYDNYFKCIDYASEWYESCMNRQANSCIASCRCTPGHPSFSITKKLW